MTESFKIPDNYYYSRQADKSILLFINYTDGSEKSHLVSGLVREVLDFTFVENNRFIEEEKIKNFLRTKYSFDDESFEVFYKNLISIFMNEST